MLTPAARAEIERAARPTIQRAFRYGLLVGFALGFVACCIVLAMTR